MSRLSKMQTISSSKSYSLIAAALVSWAALSVAFGEGEQIGKLSGQLTIEGDEIANAAGDYAGAGRYTPINAPMLLGVLEDAPNDQGGWEAFMAFSRIRLVDLGYPTGGDLIWGMTGDGEEFTAYQYGDNVAIWTQ